jgi:uncharacterized protein (DUF58 family)
MFAVNIFYSNYEVFLLLLLIVIIPVVSWVLFIISRIGIKILISAPNQSRQKQDVTVYTKATNACPVPLYRGRLNLHIAYSNSNIDKEVQVNTYAFLHQAQENKITFVPLHCGIVSIHISTLDTYDYIGLFHKKYFYDSTKSVVVFPELIVADLDKRIAEEKEQENECIVTTNITENAEVVNLRQYIPGDPIKSVHWKLSVKLDQLICKQYGEYVRKNFYIIVDLSLLEDEDFRFTLDKIYQATYAIANFYMENQLDASILAWDGDYKRLEQLGFNNKRTLDEAMIYLMSIQCGDDAGKRAEQEFCRNHDAFGEGHTVLFITGKECISHTFSVINVKNIEISELINIMYKAV